MRSPCRPALPRAHDPEKWPPVFGKDHAQPKLMPVRYLSPPGAITPTGPWSLGARAGDFVFVAGMRGIDPATNSMLGTEEERIRRAFANMKTIAASEGASLTSCVRLTVFVTDMKRLRPLVNKVQEELWAGGPYPPRTIVEVAKLNQDDIFEVEGTFYAPK
jgi:2-iminobutanoate/2-iminopropanoate deaminase